MKKFSPVCIILAGVSLLTGILSKVGILPHEFLDIRHHTYIDLTLVFLVAAIALKCCCHHHGQCKDKDGEKKAGEACCK